ncbi:nucleotidyl transferase AbiEii/AbiGii toxin family protein [Psychromonas sp. Urea-02u-13]|uniref:nucleotidyl transferase AbiEii/AbiGii toxin family protein n=1 Tax=Psychromonas sp. Urea-02u-13 TaxID=2058326 RepID=UPI000C345DB2|nr:nucleotidyl transferase AbiEii/AbiGii toxin family protein [Psychromonas sp. Urea-02u-13]PKG39807.1 nucleotidyl transferase AbiEii/AbiGii toxin family protein [Psychromonas sp. Urea-02u-13]
MTTNQENFNYLVERAIEENGGSSNKPVIEKELLHYDILFALDQAGMLDDVVFQGGTSLRLCYGSSRYSEDLDFAGGYDFNSETLSKMKDVIEKYIGDRYGLEITVKEPNSLKEDPKYAELKIDKWQIAIVTAPEQKHIAKQRIKLEVANIPAHTKVPLPLKLNYDFLPDGYRDTLIYVEPLEEIMADKIISLPATQRYVRHRDIWDLMWLQQEGATINKELIEKKIIDYKIEGFMGMLDARIASIKDIVNGSDFDQEMKRFLSQEAYDRTLGKEKFREFLISNLVGLLSSAKKELSGNADNEAGFRF